jgi:hypothetical protein
MLSQLEIRDHYRRPEIREQIIRVCTSGALSRAGCGDSHSWYKVGTDGKHKFNLSNEADYNRIVRSHRTLYYTLNLFDELVYTVDFNHVEQADSPQISRLHTKGYTFGVDIDKEHGQDIHAPEVKKAVEDMGQYFSNYLREYIPNSVNVAFSGGGIYVMVHHKAFDVYFEKFKGSQERDVMLLTLLDAFDALIGVIRDEFFRLHPEHIGKVKPDHLNGSQRIFKSLFSVHKTRDYAVVPLDSENVSINFENATLPISQSVIDSANEWYVDYDDGGYFIERCLKPHLQRAYDVRKNKKVAVHDIDISKFPLADTSSWPPCMRNTYSMSSCGEGKTRALAIFASFLGQMAIPEQEAKGMFSSLAARWGAETSNIFESYFLNMKTPACDTLRSSDDRGFPKGMSIKKLGVCKPDARCMQVPSETFNLRIYLLEKQFSS